MTDPTQRLAVLRLPGTDTLIIKKEAESPIFRTTSDSIIMNKEVFVFILRFMVSNEIIHPGVVLGILEEINTN
jgi:hypothetical protein